LTQKIMRFLTLQMRKKYGCDHCADNVKRKLHEWDERRECIHDECPYKELQKFSSYSEYLKAINDRSVSEMLKILEKLE
jgi:hypothetical protein